MIFPGMNIVQGEHDVLDALMRQRRGPFEFPQGGLFPQEQPMGVFGRINQALEPLGGATNLGAQLLANSYGSGSFGEALGRSVLGAQQSRAAEQDRRLREEYLQAQIEQMRRPESGPLVPIMRDGKRVYGTRDEARGAEVPVDAPNSASKPSMEALYDRAVAQGYKGTLLQFARDYAQAGHVAHEPLVAVQSPDGQSVFVPRSQAVGQSPASPREGALPTEGERVAANYLGRMQAAEGLLGDYTPSLIDYVAAQQVTAGGPVRSGIANQALSPEGQQYYQAAADWVRAKLRKESGAVISPAEMEQEIKTYFPVPGDSKATIEQKRKARLQAQAGMQQMSGRAAPRDEGKAGGKAFRYVPGQGLVAK